MHASLKLIPTVDTQRTPALNEAAISQTQLVRFMRDRENLGLVQKLGGWSRFFPNVLPAVPRNLWAWRDNVSTDYLAVGCETSVSNPELGAPLYVYDTEDSLLRTITPQYSVQNTAVDCTTTLGSNIVTITDPGFSAATTAASGDGTTATLTYAGTYVFPVGATVVVAGVTPAGFNATATVTASSAGSVSYANATVGPQTVAGTVGSGGSNITAYDAVFIPAHISVGGLILFGLYQCIAASSTSYQIEATDALGDPALATASVANGGLVAEFDTTSGTSIVTVTLVGHGYAPGDTYPVLITTTVGGVTLEGNYTVLTVPTADTFTFQAPQNASATTSAFINGGDARYVYYISFGPLPEGTGYSTGGYSTGGYSTGTAAIPAAGFPITATDWSLDNWGEILIASPNGAPTPTDDPEPGGPIFQWSPSTSLQNAQIIPQAPITNHSVFLAMPQRQIVALGSTFTGIQDHLLIRWCDLNNFNSWIATPVNQAGSYRLTKGSRIVGGGQGPQQGLIWTDLALWAMQYVNLPDVYNFNEIAVGCGLIARKAFGFLNNITFWMGPTQFYLYSDGVRDLPCTVWDFVFQQLDTANVDKIRCAPNSRFNEISWFFPTTSGGGEVDAYVKYSVGTSSWDYGYLSRTAWINQSVLGPPIGGAPSGIVFQHETSPNADGQPMSSSFQTGYFTLQDGDLMSFIDQVWPDFKWGYFNGAQNAELLLTFYVADYPGQTPRVHGPYSMTQATQYITPRLRGRLVSIKFESNDIDTFWRIGAPRYRITPAGKF
jgi:hypothetical protein